MFPEGTVLLDRSHGSARLSSVLDGTHRGLSDSNHRTPALRRPFTSPPPTYRGCSPDVRRRGVLRATRTVDVLALRRSRRLAGRALPAPSAFVNLELDFDAYAGVPCWTGGPTQWAHITVAIAYDLHYTEIRERMCNGGIARKSLIVIAAAMARYADWTTGRNCRPTNDQLATATGFHERTIQRAHECLRLLGVATEVLRGRQRTYIERMASWRMGDRHRGWASVWALHDNAHINRVIHRLSPHLERSQLTTTSPCFRSLITIRAGAPRARQHGATRRRPPPNDPGRRLATQWRRDPQSPPWAHRYTVDSWAAMLAAPAAASWTAHDLTALVSDWLGTGHWIPADPARPIALMGALLAWHTSHNELADRPAALEQARDAHALATEHARRTAAVDGHREHLEGRLRGKHAATGPGRAAAFAELAAARVRGAHRRAAIVAAESSTREALITQARYTTAGADDHRRSDLWR